jgi:hypothetical protein
MQLTDTRRVVRLRKLRLTAAVVLVSAIFLPLSECSKSDNHPPVVSKSFSETLFPQTNADFSYQYGFRYINFTVLGIVTLLAFVWPLLFVVFADKRTSLRARRVLSLLELLLCAGSLYWVHAIMLEGRWLYGAYIVLAAIAVFAGSGLFLALIHRRNNAQRK